MTYSLSLACRGVRHQASGEMFASLSRDQHGAGTANIHAGSALLATGGICMLGDLGCYKKDRLDAIQSGRALKWLIKFKYVTRRGCSQQFTLWYFDFLPFLNFSQFWRAARCLCSSQGRNMVRMLTSSFPSQSSAASGPSLTPRMPLDRLGGQTVPYWEPQWVQSQHGVVLPLYSSLKTGFVQ